MNRSSTSHARRADLVAACRLLARRGLVEAYGHVSARLADGRLLVSPRRALGLVRPEAVVVADVSGRLLHGRGPLPSEFPMHAAVYRSRPDVGGICRIHSRYALVWSVIGEPVRVAHGLGCFLNGEVPVYPKTVLIEDERLGREVAECLGEGTAVLLRGNGSLVVGGTIREAVINAIALEEVAWLQYHARLVGQPKVLARHERVTRGEADYQRVWDFLVTSGTPRPRANHGRRQPSR